MHTMNIISETESTNERTFGEAFRRSECSVEPPPFASIRSVQERHITSPASPDPPYGSGVLRTTRLATRGLIASAPASFRTSTMTTALPHPAAPTAAENEAERVGSIRDALTDLFQEAFDRAFPGEVLSLHLILYDTAADVFIAERGIRRADHQSMRSSIRRLSMRQCYGDLQETQRQSPEPSSEGGNGRSDVWPAGRCTEAAQGGGCHDPRGSGEQRHHPRNEVPTASPFLM